MNTSAYGTLGKPSHFVICDTLADGGLHYFISGTDWTTRIEAVLLSGNGFLSREHAIDFLSVGTFPGDKSRYCVVEVK